MKREWKPAYTRAEQQRLQALHINLTHETRTLFGRAAHSVLLHRSVRRDGQGVYERLHVYDQAGHALEPLPDVPVSQLVCLLERLLDLHDLGHWLLDDTLASGHRRTSLPDSRPISPHQAPPPDVPWA